jgi:hypothetical protein
LQKSVKTQPVVYNDIFTDFVGPIWFGELRELTESLGDWFISRFYPIVASTPAADC